MSDGEGTARDHRCAICRGPDWNYEREKDVAFVCPACKRALHIQNLNSAYAKEVIKKLEVIVNKLTEIGASVAMIR